MQWQTQGRFFTDHDKIWKRRRETTTGMLTGACKDCDSTRCYGICLVRNCISQGYINIGNMMKLVLTFLFLTALAILKKWEEIIKEKQWELHSVLFQLHKWQTIYISGMVGQSSPLCNHEKLKKYKWVLDGPRLLIENYPDAKQCFVFFSLNFNCRS